MKEDTWGVDDGDGNQITTGLSPEIHARRVAQSIANERGTSVWLYNLAEAREASENDEEHESEEIVPVNHGPDYA